MDDSKLAFNLSGQGGNGNVSVSITNIKNDILGLSNVITNTLQPAIDKMVRSLNSVKLPGLVDAKGNPISSGGGVPSEKVADNGVRTSAGGGTTAGSNKVADNGTAGGGGGGNVFNRVAAAAGGFSNAVGRAQGISDAIGNLIPSTQTAVMQDYLTNRSAFFGQGGYAGTLAQQTGNVRALQQALARNGTALNPMDTTNALAAAQATGLSGASNFNQVMQGAAQASNFTPGLGLTGATQEIGSNLNAPGTVNMLRTIGINLRGANGSMLSLPQVVDEIWNYLTRYNAGKAPDKKSIQSSLIPGNGIYNMLNNLFNGDATMVQMVSNMLLAKAQFGGQALGTITKDQLVGAGIQTQTVKDIASQTAAQTNLLTNTSSAISGGYDAATKFNTAVTNFQNSVNGFTKVFGFGNALTGGLLGGIMGTGTKVLGKLFSLLGFADGGNVKQGGPTGQNDIPYIVGEMGPELFVPKTDGVIIPNDLLGKRNRASGGPVYGQQDFAKQLLAGLGAPLTSQNIADLVMWEGKEGGNWKNTASYNPLNTSYQMPGSVNFNSRMSGSGVQAYQNWAQGVAATVGTLTGKDAASRGYTNIVNLLKNGTASQADFFKAMQASAWDANHYAGGSSSSAVSATPAVTGSLAAAAASAEGLGSTGGGTTVNYGGVTINVNGAQSPTATAAAIQKALTNTKIGKS